jgi:hypothetical protein
MSYVLFWGLAPFHNIASFCKGKCGTSQAHVIKAMMTCLDPYYLIQYSGELLKKIKQGFASINGVNQCLTTSTKDSRAALVIYFIVKTCVFTNKYSKRGKVIRGSSN